MIKSSRKATDDEWDNMVDAVESTIYFQTREWFEIWANYAGFEIDTKLIHFDNGKKVLLPITHINLFKGLVKVNFLAPKGMGGFVSKDELDESEKRELFRLLKRVGIVYFAANPYDTLSNEFNKFNNNDTTHVLDLREGFEPIFKKWSDGHHRAAAKGIRKGVTVDVASTDDDWSTYYQLYRCSVANWGEKATNSYNSRLFDIMKNKRSEKIKLWVARYQGQIISGAICLYHNRHVAAWNGATDRQFLKLNGPHMVLHFSIRDAVEKGFMFYDLLPSGGHNGVVKFKDGFGATQMPVNIYLSPSLRLADVVRSSFRNNFIYKRMMRNTGFE